MPTIHLIGAAGFAVVAGLGFTVPAAADAPAVALILGVKGSPIDDAFACRAIDVAKKLGFSPTTRPPRRTAMRARAIAA